MGFVNDAGNKLPLKVSFCFKHFIAKLYGTNYAYCHISLPKILLKQF